MPRTIPSAVVTLLVLLVASPPSQADGDAHGALTREFSFEKVSVAEAMVVFRSIAGTSQLEPLDEGRLLVTDTAENLEVVARLVRMIEAPPAVGDSAESYALPSGDSAIVGIALERITQQDAMTALRILRIQRVATSRDSLIIIRDTPEQVRLAQKLLQVIEGSCSGSS